LESFVDELDGAMGLRWVVGARRAGWRASGAVWGAGEVAREVADRADGRRRGGGHRRHERGFL